MTESEKEMWAVLYNDAAYFAITYAKRLVAIDDQELRSKAFDYYLSYVMDTVKDFDAVCRIASTWMKYPVNCAVNDLPAMERFRNEYGYQMLKLNSRITAYTDDDILMEVA
jgi:hypothetical protein